ncbi:unnamed protein product [Alopecurus aequalis]
MDKNDNGRWDDLPMDALVEILVRLPPNARLRFRHVCRHWRELIDQRTATDMRSRTKIIAVVEKGSASLVIDLLTPQSTTDLWQRIDAATAQRYNTMSIVGTCNGLVCLCDNDLTPGRAITVANPSTGEAMRLPPMQISSPAAKLIDNSNISSRSWHHQTYTFAYHETTTMGLRYKVVHVPCHFDRFWKPDVVHVFTLGEASWRDVRTGTDARCSLGSSISLVEVDGTVYWLTEDTGKIMSFDLRHERVLGTKPLPVPVSAMPSTRCLTKVHGRLGVAVGDGVDDSAVTVWVLEGERWSHRYTLEAHGPWPEKWMRPTRELAGPHLVHGDYFLTLTHGTMNIPSVLYRHTLSEAARLQDGVVHITYKDDAPRRYWCVSSALSTRLLSMSRLRSR